MVDGKLRLTALRVMTAVVFFLPLAPSVCAADGDSKRVSLPKAAVKETTEDVLSDLRDVRLCLSQVKQQAVNIFMEATRTVMTPTEPALERTPEEINKKMLNPKANYMPPRKEWLIFYVNTLEPTIHLLAEDLKDADASHDRYPSEFSSVLRPLWKPWHNDILSINKSLDEMQEIIGNDKGNNVPLANIALDIYSKISDLEKVRYKAATAVRAVVTKKKAPKLK